MNGKIFFLILVTMSAGLSSCTKEDNDTTEPTFEEVITAQPWVKSSWGAKLNTLNPDDTLAPYENRLEPCDSGVLWSFKENGVIEQYLSYDCRNYNRGLFHGSQNWTFNKTTNWLSISCGPGCGNGFIVKQFAKDEIYLYVIFDPYDMGGESGVEIIKLIPN